MFSRHQSGLEVVGSFLYLHEADVAKALLESEGVAAVVTLENGKTLHLLVGLNADQYAAEMRGQLAA